MRGTARVPKTDHHLDPPASGLQPGDPHLVTLDVGAGSGRTRDCVRSPVGSDSGRQLGPIHSVGQRDSGNQEGRDNASDRQLAHGIYNAAAGRWVSAACPGKESRRNARRSSNDCLGATGDVAVGGKPGGDGWRPTKRGRRNRRRPLERGPGTAMPGRATSGAQGIDCDRPVGQTLPDRLIGEDQHPARPDCGVIGLSQPSTRRSFAEETLTFAEQQREDDRRYSSMRPSRTRVLMS